MKTSILDRIEQGYERVLQVLEALVDHAVNFLAQYAQRVARFLRHIFLQTLKLLWIIGCILIYSLAPAYTASFGHELIRRGPIFGWIVFTCGVLISLIGGIGLIGVAIAAPFGYFTRSKNSNPQSTTETPAGGRSRGARGLLIFIDVFAIVIIAVTYRWFIPGYNFESPLLRDTQNILRLLIPKLGNLLATH